jgi:hypothetical protein
MASGGAETRNPATGNSNPQQVVFRLQLLSVNA